MSVTTRFWLARAVLALGACLASGCYTYVPMGAPGGLASSSEVRVRPSAEYRAGLRSLLNFEPMTVQGRVLDVGEEGFRLEIVTASVEYGARGSPLTQQVVVPWSEVLVLEEKHFDRRRTSLLAGTLAVLGSVVVAFMLGGEAGGTLEAPPNGGDEAIGAARMRVP